MFDTLLSLAHWLMYCIFYGLILLMVAIIAVRFYFSRKRGENKRAGGYENIIAFYHPFTNACGGGEKVLFFAICSIAEIVKDTKSRLVIYTIEELDADVILKKAKERFNFELDLEICLIRINRDESGNIHAVTKRSLLSQAFRSIISV